MRAQWGVIADGGHVHCTKAGGDFECLVGVEDYCPCEAGALEEVDWFTGDPAPSRALANPDNFGGVAEWNLRGRHRSAEPFQRGRHSGREVAGRIGAAHYENVMQRSTAQLLESRDVARERF